MTEQNIIKEKKQIKWYEQYLPETLDLKDLKPEYEVKLSDVFNECEKETDKYLEKIVKKKFRNILKEIGYRNLNECLPKDVKWKSLNKEKRQDIAQIYSDSITEKRNIRTIKKRFKKYLIDDVLIL